MYVQRRLSNPPKVGITPDDDLQTMIDKIESSARQGIKDYEEQQRLEEERQRKGFLGRLFS